MASLLRLVRLLKIPVGCIRVAGLKEIMATAVSNSLRHTTAMIGVGARYSLAIMVS